MPVIFRLGSFRIVIFVNDHEPPHVHCIGKGEKAVIEIESGSVQSNNGIHSKDLKMQKAHRVYKRAERCFAYSAKYRQSEQAKYCQSEQAKYRQSEQGLVF